MAHPEWGIGTVQHVDGDEASVLFHGQPSRLRYCMLEDLVPHRFKAGDIVFSRMQRAYGSVLRLREMDGLVTYIVQFSHGRMGVPEGDIDPAPRSNEPSELLRQGELHDPTAFVLALQARRLQYAYSYDELVSLSNARIELLPHQVFVAHRVLTAFPQGFLLADEVGLGKTIEAGLIIKELRARNATCRVLIVAPAGLVPQWVDELRKKFNEDFKRLDSLTIGTHEVEHGPDQVWQVYDSVVTSLHFLCHQGNEAAVDALAGQRWDLIVFDEAHHLRRYHKAGGRSTTIAYEVAQRLQAAAEALLLLTATPLQLHAFELYSLVELLDPRLFPTFDDFERYRLQIPLLNTLARRLEEFAALSIPEQ